VAAEPTEKHVVEMLERAQGGVTVAGWSELLKLFPGHKFNTQQMKPLLRNMKRAGKIRIETRLGGTRLWLVGYKQPKKRMPHSAAA
jgi:hypothetical protein